MQHPLKYLTHLSTFWPIRMTATRHLRQNTCCVPFFEYRTKSVSFTQDKQKTWLLPYYERFLHSGQRRSSISSWSWARWIFRGTWHMSAVTRRVRPHYRVCRHLSLRRVWPRAATLPHCRPAPSSGPYAAIMGDSAGKIISMSLVPNKTLKCSSWNPLLSPLTKYPLYRVALKFVFGF